MTTVLAIDQGTSGTKAVVVNEDGIVHGQSERVITPSYLPGGGVEPNPHELLASVVDAGREAISKSRIPIDIVSIARARPCWPGNPRRALRCPT